MKTKVTLACLALVGAGFAADMRMPVAPGVVELSAGISLDRVTGAYDASGSLNEDAVGAGSPIVYGLPLRAEYGVMPGLSIALTLPVIIEESSVTPTVSGGRTGIERPELMVKYAVPDLGVAGFLNIYVPFGLGDNAELPATMRLDRRTTEAGDPGAAIAIGAVYSNTFAGNYRVSGLAAYQYSVPYTDGDAKNSDVITVAVKPEYRWDAQVGTYLGIRYNHVLESKDSDGNAIPNIEGYRLTIAPGFNLVQNERIAYDVAIPVTVAGENQYASWGLHGTVRVTLPL